MDSLFDKTVTRRGTGSYKWDTPVADDVLPMWVADMDFAVAPCIQRALEKRVAHGVFGYTHVDDAYYDAVVQWFARRHAFAIDRNWILYTTGVVPAISCCLRALCMNGEKVLVQTPVYNCFFSSIRNQGCVVEENRLLRSGDSYVIDFDDFERKCSDEKVTAFLLCNPHNPAGRAWTAGELKRMNDICMRHNVKVIADEIHCEIVMPGYSYTPFASVSDECLGNSVSLSSPSKAFNTVGLQIANIVCRDAALRRRIDRAINIFEVCDVNPFGPVALKAAYSSEGAEWLERLNAYIHGNYTMLKDFLVSHLPAVKVLRLEATYLAWLDISGLALASAEAWKKLLDEGRLMLSCGTEYGAVAGEGYLRMNLACPAETLEEALCRLRKAFG
jgi:cysteine-S-conjugate beta-lyase